MTAGAKQLTDAALKPPEQDRLQVASAIWKSVGGTEAHLADLATPARAQTLAGAHRWHPAFPAPRFPYVIRYRLSANGETVQFLSILPGARPPDTGQKRTIKT